MGGGRVELRRAARAGLLLDVASPLDYLNADPGHPTTPGDPEDAEHRVHGERELSDVLLVDAHGDKRGFVVRDVDGCGDEPARARP